MNLWDLRVSDTAIIDSVSTSKKSKFSGVLNEFGFKKNVMIKCLHKTIFNGPRVYQIEHITCTLCMQGAKQILVHQ